MIQRQFLFPKIGHCCLVGMLTGKFCTTLHVHILHWKLIPLFTFKLALQHNTQSLLCFCNSLIILLTRVFVFFYIYTQRLVIKTIETLYEKRCKVFLFFCLTDFQWSLGANVHPDMLWGSNHTHGERKKERGLLCFHGERDK